ncbi:MAG: hypothetical protein VYC34_10555, partial [Planctomycetota bacterium]|nr:hypothetical protein [Planctomycetota bacterium]
MKSETFAAAANDGSGDCWDAEVVPRADWPAFVAGWPASTGSAWTPPANPGAFDDLFGAGADAAAVFWVSASLGSPINPGESETQFYYGPVDLDNMPSHVPAAFFGDGVVIESGIDAALRRADAFGVALASQGDVTLETFDGALTVCCSSGKDGICIEPVCDPDLVGTTWYFEGGISLESGTPIDFDGTEASFLQVDMRGQVGGASDSLIGTLRMQGALLAAGGGVDTIVDFSGVGATRLEITLLDAAGNPVANYETDNPATMVITEEGVPSLRADMRCEANGDASIVDLGGDTDVIDDSSGLSYPNVRRIRARAVDIATPAASIGSFEITTGGIDPITFDRMRVQHFGEWFEAEGVSSLSGAIVDNEPSLVVGNIGSSGCDGFRIDLDEVGAPPVERVDLRWRQVAPCAGVSPPPPLCEPEDAMIELSSTGAVGGMSGVELGTMRFERSAAGGTVSWDITADYTPVGSTTHQVEVYDDGALVGMVTGVPTGFVTSVMDPPKGCGKGEAEIGG